MSTTEFLKKIKSGAILGWERHRILPSITGAQGILEGASGTSKLAQAPYYNQFGIKASADWTGKKVKMMTWEEIGGRKVHVEAEFRWYDSIEESVADHASFFTSTEWRKNNYKEVVGEKDYRKAARALQNAGYATDSQYANKLIRLIETHGLRAWDEEAFSGSVAPTLAPVSSEGAMITPTTETDVVGRYNIEDLEYKDDLLHSPKGESVIYNPTLNDAYGFQTKSGDVLWIDHVLEVNSEDPQEIMDEAIKYMKENAQPDAQYRVKLKHLPDNISIGDTGMFVDHKFNPPLYIEARILEIVTSISNPENDSVVVGNVREVKSQTDASIRALQKELQDTRKKLVDDYFAQKELEVSIQANNGLALIDTGVTHAIELIAEPQNEIKLVANTPYKINLNAPVGANVDTYTLTGELLNNTFTAEFEDVVNPIVVEPEPVIDETLISGIVGSDNHGSTVESPQGDKVAIVDSVADFTGLRVKELNFKFYDATGTLVHEEDVPVNINSKISHSVFKEDVIFASMAITSKADVTVQGLSFKEPSIFGDGAKTTDLMAYFNFDIPHNYIWTRVSDDDDADLLWNDRNKFNNSNILKITIEDINGNKSTFILTVYDENGNVIAGTSETVTVDKSPDKISAEVEEAILEGERLKQKAKQAYEDAVAEAERLVAEQDEIWQGKMENYDEQIALIDASATSAQTKAEQALTEAGISTDLAQTAKDLADTAKANASTALSNASQAVADAQTAVTQAGQAITSANTAKTNAQTALDNAQTALTETDSTKATVNSLTKRVDEVEGEVELKASQETVDRISGTVSNHSTTLSQHATAIASKAESKLVNAIKGTVDTHTTEISQHATDIASKASATSVNTLTGRVSTAETTITQHATQISARLTSSQVNSLVDSKGFSTVNYVDSQITATAESLGLELTRVEGKIPTEIGSRNYFVRKDAVFDSALTWYFGEPFAETNSLFTGYIPTLLGDEFRASEEPSDGQIAFYNSGKEFVGSKKISSGSIIVDGYYGYRPATIPSDETIAFMRIAFRDNYLIGKSRSALRVMINKGTIFADWELSPEDREIEAQSYVNNQISITSNSINSTITGIIGDISKGKNLIPYTERGAISGASGTDWDAEQAQNRRRTPMIDVRGVGLRNLVLSRNEAPTTGNWSLFRYRPDGTYIDYVERAGGTPINVSDAVGFVRAVWYGASDANFQLEIGDSITGFVPYSSNVSQYQIVKATQDLDGFKQTVQNTYGTKNEISQLSQKANSIEALVGTDGENIAQIALTSDLFSTKVRALSSGANLHPQIRDGYALSRASATILTDNAMRIVFESADGGTPFLNLPRVSLNNGSKYTLSFKVKLVGGSGSRTLTYGIRTGGLSDTTIILEPNSERYVEQTFTANATTDTARVLMFSTGFRQGVTIDVRDMVLNLGSEAVPWTPSLKPIETQVTQLADSWALTLKSGNDIKTQINASTNAIRLSSKFIHLNGSSLIDDATIKSAHIDSLNANKITGNTADFNTIRTGVLTANAVTSTHIKADTALFDKLFSTTSATDRLVAQGAWITNANIISLDVGAITGDKANFLTLSFESLNSNMKLGAGAIRIQNSDGDFATMNTIPEFRSQDSAGTAAIMGKGRSHYYSGNQNRFYIGSNLEGLPQYGIHIGKGQTFGIYRNSDNHGGTPAQYYNTPKGWGAVQVVEELMRLGHVSSNFYTASAFIRNLNGWGNSWPVLQPGEPVMYKAAVAGNSSGVETLWSMGTSSAGVTRLYSHPEHVFAYRIEVQDRARFIAKALFENSFTNNSDRRIKHDIKDTEVRALDHLDSLTFKEYKLNSNGQKVPLGLIAQDSGILRVKGEDEGDYEGIDGLLMPMLAMKGVQELHAIVKAQAEEIKQLKEIINQ